MLFIKRYTQSFIISFTCQFDTIAKKITVKRKAKKYGSKND